MKRAQNKRRVMTYADASKLSRNLDKLIERLDNLEPIDVSPRAIHNKLSNIVHELCVCHDIIEEAMAIYEEESERGQ